MNRRDFDDVVLHQHCDQGDYKYPLCSAGYLPLYTTHRNRATLLKKAKKASRSCTELSCQENQHKLVTIRVWYCSDTGLNRRASASGIWVQCKHQTTSRWNTWLTYIITQPTTRTSFLASCKYENIDKIEHWTPRWAKQRRVQEYNTRIEVNMVKHVRHCQDHIGEYYLKKIHRCQGTSCYILWLRPVPRPRSTSRKSPRGRIRTDKQDTSKSQDRGKQDLSRTSGPGSPSVWDPSTHKQQGTAWQASHWVAMWERPDLGPWVVCPWGNLCRIK